MKPKVFLSHSKKDKSFVEKLADDLKPERVDVWYDDWEIPSGVSLRNKIFNEGIGQCDLFFVYLTENSIKSRWVEQELDVALQVEMENEGCSLALYTNSDSIRGQLRKDLQLLRIPTISDNNYSSRLLEIVSLAWESWKLHNNDQIIAGTNIGKTIYNYSTFFSQSSKEKIVIAQNLRTLISLGFLDYVKAKLENDESFTLILTTPEAMKAISDIGMDHYIETIKELRDFYFSLNEKQKTKIKIHFHPGATSLSAMIRNKSSNDSIVFTPKWATDLDPDNRIFCVVDDKKRSDLFDRLIGHISYMTSPSFPDLKKICKSLNLDWNEAEHRH